MKTIWKDIKGYKGKYKVSNTGEILSLHTNKPMAQLLGSNGYYKCGLRKEGRKDRLITHRLVALAFIKNPESKPQVNHIDGNKLNNNASNLEWVTAKENTKHAYDTGLRKSSDHNKRKKLGSTSKYHYVDLIMMKGYPTFRTVVKIDSNMKGRFSKSRCFSIKKYGKLDAELMAAKAANELIAQYPQFKGLALNII